MRVRVIKEADVKDGFTDISTVLQGPAGRDIRVFGTDFRWGVFGLCGGLVKSTRN